MKRGGVFAAAAVLAALGAFKLLSPGASGAVRDALGLVSGAEVLEAVLFPGAGRAQEAAGDFSVSAAAAEKTEAEPLRLAAEEAVNRGEFPPEPEPPAVVAAFLERQAEFADYALPECVDYDYTALPFSCSSPVQGVTSSGFGYRVHPIENAVRFHYGTDFAAQAGTDITAFAAGTVIYSGPSDSYGNYLTIDHGDGWTSLYAHCSYLYAETGQRVEEGEKIALVGATGIVTGPHLHFELRHDGAYINPEYYCGGE